MDIKTTVFAIILIIVLAWRNIRLSKLENKESKYSDIAAIIKKGIKSYKVMYVRLRNKCKKSEVLKDNLHIEKWDAKMAVLQAQKIKKKGR